MRLSLLHLCSGVAFSAFICLPGQHNAVVARIPCPIKTQASLVEHLIVRTVLDTHRFLGKRFGYPRNPPRSVFLAGYSVGPLKAQNRENFCAWRKAKCFRGGMAMESKAPREAKLGGPCAEKKADRCWIGAILFRA